MPRELNVALIGYKFMGKAHSHAYRDVDFFFPGECKPVMKVICGRNEAPLRDAANAWRCALRDVSTHQANLSI